MNQWCVDCGQPFDQEYRDKYCGPVPDPVNIVAKLELVQRCIKCYIAFDSIGCIQAPTKRDQTLARTLIEEGVVRVPTRGPRSVNVETARGYISSAGRILTLSVATHHRRVEKDRWYVLGHLKSIGPCNCKWM